MSIIIADSGRLCRIAAARSRSATSRNRRRLAMPVSSSTTARFCTRANRLALSKAVRPCATRAEPTSTWWASAVGSVEPSTSTPTSDVRDRSGSTSQPRASGSRSVIAAGTPTSTPATGSSRASSASVVRSAVTSRAVSP
jgi:hypothetical protein